MPRPTSLSMAMSRAVPLHHAVHHRQAQAGAAFALGGEERLEAAAPRILVHADAGVDDLDSTRAGSSARVRSVNVPPSGMASTALNTRLVSASRISLSAPMTAGSGRASSSLQLDRDAALLRHVVPAHAREIHDLLHELVELHALEHHLRFARAIELAHARHGLRDVADGALDDLQLPAARLAQSLLALQQRLGVQRDR